MHESFSIFFFQFAFRTWHHSRPIMQCIFVPLTCVWRILQVCLHATKSLRHHVAVSWRVCWESVIRPHFGAYESVHTVRSYTLKLHLNILLSFCRSSKSCFSLKFSNQEFVFISYPIFVPPPSFYPPWFTLIIIGEPYNCEAPRYAILSILLSLPSLQTQTFLSADPGGHPV